MAESERSRWNTEITDVAPDEIRLRGYRIDALMGRVGYAGTVYLLITGELPSAAAERVLDAILVSSIDHGATPPSTLAARTAASTGAPLNAALAAGILSINEYHGGAIEKCMARLAELAEAEAGGEAPTPGGIGPSRTGDSPSPQEEAPTKEGKAAPTGEIPPSDGTGVPGPGDETPTPGPGDRAAAAAALVARSLGEKRRLSGFGHRIHRRDPRVARLFAVAEEAGLSGEWVARARALESALVEATGKPLYLNVDGAIAALLRELGIPAEVSNALFMVARLPGLIAHVTEEQRTQRPMRRIVPGAQQYDGPPPRELPEKGR